jgi:hypothetical protein
MAGEQIGTGTNNVMHYEIRKGRLGYKDNDGSYGYDNTIDPKKVLGIVEGKLKKEKVLTSDLPKQLDSLSDDEKKKRKQDAIDNARKVADLAQKEVELADEKYEGEKSKINEEGAKRAYENYKVQRGKYINLLEGIDKSLALKEAQIEDLRRQGEYKKAAEEENKIKKNISDVRQGKIDSIKDATSQFFDSIFNAIDSLNKISVKRISPGKLSRDSAKNAKLWERWSSELDSLDKILPKQLTSDLRGKGIGSLGTVDALFKANDSQRTQIVNDITKMMKIAGSQTQTEVLHKFSGNVKFEVDKRSFTIEGKEIKEYVKQEIAKGVAQYTKVKK